MYNVRVRIGDYRSEFDASKDFATLYREARKLVKGGKYYGVRVSFVISDWRTGEPIVRLYSLNSRVSDGWVAAQSSLGKYHTHIQF